MTETIIPLHDKRGTLDRMLEDEYVIIHISPIAPGAVLPDHLTKDPMVTLKLSRLFRGAIELEENVILADLIFGDNYFTCHIPYTSIWGCTSASGKNIVWPAETPPELLEQVKEVAPPQDSTKPTAPKGQLTTDARLEPDRSSKRPVLRRVK